MNIKVFYHSRTGNTKKVAEAISKAVNVQAHPISTGFDGENVDLLIIGDGIYMSTIDKRTQDFIRSLDPAKVKRAAVFSTYGGQDRGAERMKELLTKQGISVVGESFSCRGKAWWILNRRHPSDGELEAAAEFAKKAVASIA